jgi:hypothetical protein
MTEHRQECAQPTRDCPFDEGRIEQLTRIETNQIIMIKQIDVLIQHVATQNGRLGRLENWQWAIIGGLGVLTFIAPIILKAMKVI